MADRSQGAQPSGTSGTDQVRALYEQAESTTARAFEELVSKPSFGALMARSAENAAALTRIAADAADLVWRNLRLAGRADVTRLMRQLHRTEDKLERVLQEVERLRDELAARPGSGEEPAARPASSPPRSGRRRDGAGNGTDPAAKRSSGSKR
jgi:hypothetical protein